MPADQSPSETKDALRAAMSRGAVQLSPEQISSHNVPAAAEPALTKTRTINIMDSDRGSGADKPIVITV